MSGVLPDEKQIKSGHPWPHFSRQLEIRSPVLAGLFFLGGV